MMGTIKDAPDYSELRRRAKEKLKKATSGSEDISGVSTERMARLIHELQVHQIELKMQNDELRSIQDELEKTLDKYSHLYDFSPVGYLTLIEKGIIDEANLTITSMLGVERSALIGNPFTRFILRDDHYIFYKHWQRLLETEIPQACDLRLVKKDGHGFHARLECMVIKNKGDDFRQIRVAVSDITEQNRLEEALSKSEKKYREITENMLVGVYQVTLDGKLLFANKKISEMFGYDSTKELIAAINSVEELYARSEERKTITDEIIGKGFIKNKAVEFKRKDGQSVWIKMNARRTINNDGTIILEGLMEDVTEFKRMEEQLRQVQKMESIGSLAGGIAHDFNNILAIILGNTELAIIDVPESNPAKRCLKVIQSASLRASELVQHLLSCSRKGITTRKPIKICPIIEDSLKMLRASIPADIEIRRNILCESDIILADPTQMSQVLMNLCANAVHAMQFEGGILELKLQTVEFGKQNMELNLGTGRYLKLAVSDTGHGIDPKIIGRIFDPYFTTKGLGEGTGLGLSVVQGIVKSHNGAVTLKSELGKGTVFEVLLPLTGAKAQSENKKAEAFPTGNEKILLIDDEESILNLVKKRLEMQGYQVKAKNNPVDALELFRFGPDRFDLIITDMIMPKMTGDKLAKEILSIRPDIPIILCSGYSDKIDAEKAAALGVRKYIEKPLNMSDFMIAIRKALDETKVSTHD
ncbi:MAG: PAS domain S-box protein [Deltaproteobacteria bacterium]|jgi:PAS domain S-box-containing protein|nr:PAS domain S-box protein [Deltaproteobacteria bacterium]